MGQQNLKKKAVIASVGFAALLLLAILISSFYTKILDKKTMTADIGEEKKAHYIMIIESGKSGFWESVYESAKKEAAVHDIILELSESSKTMPYSLSERMQMYLAAKVDGIILEYRGEAALEKEIEKAKQMEIPVVTLLTDAKTSGAVSCVGSNNYEMAKKYGEQIIKILTPNTKKIMVLSHGGETYSDESEILKKIDSMVKASKRASDQISMEIKKISSLKAFDREEAIWSIFQDKESLPDILVCLSERDTECAYQALINYNMVGKVEIIGYYHTDMILKAIAEGIIPSTLVLDTEQMGLYSVNALNSYKEEGYVDSFYNVDLSIIGKSQAEEEMRNEEGKTE